MFSKKLDDNLKTELFSAIPEFRNYVTKNFSKNFHELSYILFGQFGIFLRDLILDAPLEATIDKCFSFVSKLAEEDNLEINQMLKATFFEPLMDYRKTIDYSKIKL